MLKSFHSDVSVLHFSCGMLHWVFQTKCTWGFAQIFWVYQTVILCKITWVKPSVYAEKSIS